MSVHPMLAVFSAATNGAGFSRGDTKLGKGGPSETTSTVTQSNLPEYAQPFYEDMMQRGQAESTRPYQPYGGERLAPQSGQTIAGLNMAQQFAQSGSPDLNNARSLANLVGQQAMDLQNYEAGKVSNTYLGPEAWAAGQFNADQVGTGTFGSAERDQYMSPYMEAVIASSQTDAQKKALEEQAMIKAQQGTTGAFGGSRGAIQQQLAADAAQKRISDIGVTGRQAAFENAQQQFERDQGRGLQASLANQKANLEALGMGEESRQFGYQLGEQGRQKAAELGMQAQASTEELRQGGKKLGLAGLELAGGTAGQMAGFQSQADQMMMDRFKTMLGVGQTQEDFAQRQRDVAYEDFLNQTNYPRQNLQFLSSLLQGVPMTANSNVTQTAPSNPIAGGVGTLLGYQALQSLGRGVS